MQSTRQIIENYAAGTSVTADEIEKAVVLVDKFGYYGAARILGYDIKKYDNLLLAGKLTIHHMKSLAEKTFRGSVEAIMAISGNPLAPGMYDFILANESAIEAAIAEREENDYDHDWFSANTLMTMYSMKRGVGGDPIESPQSIWMRIAVTFYHSIGLEEVLTAYRDMSDGFYTPASPTIFNAGLSNGNMSSCFLMSIEDNLKSILKMGVYNAGMISKSMGGIGMDMSLLRKSEISNSGMSSGIIPIVQLYNDTVRYVDQGGRRKGAATLFLRPHHIDVEDFIELPRKVGDRYARAHDVEICLWVSRIFWKRVAEDGEWTLFCPAKTPQLNHTYGAEFERLYVEAENDLTMSSKYRKTIKARDLFKQILSVQREAGMPFLMNADACNAKSNQKNLGYIRSSNLCLEIVEYTDEKNIASCNLHSLSWRTFARGAVDRSADHVSALQDAVDWKTLERITKEVVKNVNRVIDINGYPLDKTKDGVLKPNIINKTNKRNRPVAIGGSGFDDLLKILDLTFEEPTTSLLNKMLFGCMYYNALLASVQLAVLNGEYETFRGSPASEGKLQFDLWREEFAEVGPNPARKYEDDDPIDPLSWNQSAVEIKDVLGNVIDVVTPDSLWKDLKRVIVKYGLYNSLLIALMPTASTAQIRRNCETIEAHQSNLYSRKVLNCSYPVINRHMVSDLEKLNLWNPSMVEFVRIRNGSLQNVSTYIRDNRSLFPDGVFDWDRISFLEKKYKTMWEIPQKVMMRLNADRSRYICQSSSNNLYIKDCTDDKLQAAHMYSNMLGLKTQMYYLRQKGGETVKFTADPSMIKYISDISIETPKESKEPKEKMVCNETVCMSCQ